MTIIIIINLNAILCPQLMPFLTILRHKITVKNLRNPFSVFASSDLNPFLEPYQKTKTTISTTLNPRCGTRKRAKTPKRKYWWMPKRPICMTICTTEISGSGSIPLIRISSSQIEKVFRTESTQKYYKGLENTLRIAFIRDCRLLWGQS